MQERTRSHTRRRALAVAVAAAAVAVVAACAPPDSGTTKTVSNASFEWTISREADNGALNGQPNYWSAGQSNGTISTYNATNGNATVLKKNAAGTFVPIGSESAVSWENRGKDGTGAAVTAFSPNYLGQKVRYANGTGTVDTATGAATIQWTGTFTVNFYGPLVPFWITDPKLTVDPGGAGRITATVDGLAASQANPDDPPTQLDAVPNVVIAEFANVYSGGAIATGWSSPTKFLNNTITVPSGATPQVPKTAANAGYWGAWPQAFVDFQQQTGLGSYWYTSGSASIDPKKPQEPVTVSYTLNP